MKSLDRVEETVEAVIDSYAVVQWERAVSLWVRFIRVIICGSVHLFKS